MQRRFNYTDRIRLLQEDVRFSMRQKDEEWSFEAQLTLNDYDLPGDSLVFVEAYRQTSWMRFEWGTVADLRPPESRVLSEFDSPEDVLFRVRITSPGTAEEPHGLLLAEADRIRLSGSEEGDERSDPLLPVVPADLGDELWRVDFTDKPRLFLNRMAGDYKQLGRHPVFVSVVYPAAMREILTNIVLVEGHRDFDDPDDPRSRWLRFAVEVLGVGEPPPEAEDSEPVARWIVDAVAAFARQHRLLEQFQNFWNEETNS